MPRAAAEPNLQFDEPSVITTLKMPAAATERTVTKSGRKQYVNTHELATAFITNLSGGAACYDVDLSLVAEQAVSSDIKEAIADMRRLMAFADTAGWRIASAEDAKAVVVAHATTGAGDNASTDSQEYTLHIDITGAPPISAVSVSERVNTATMPKWGIIATPDDVATMASRRPGTAMACEIDESEICPVADS